MENSHWQGTCPCVMCMSLCRTYHRTNAFTSITQEIKPASEYSPESACLEVIAITQLIFLSHYSGSKMYFNQKRTPHFMIKVALLSAFFKSFSLSRHTCLFITLRRFLLLPLNCSFTKAVSPITMPRKYKQQENWFDLTSQDTIYDKFWFLEVL